jgi:predicted ATPase
MFTRLRLTNFKAWRDTGDVALKPVTMFLGTNSSGKSSLMQSLLLLKQTVQSPDRMIHLNLGGDEVNDLFNFGDFDSVLKQKTQAPRQLSLRLDFARSDARVPQGQLECVYGQTSAGSVVTNEMTLRTETRQFKAVRREKGTYSVYVDADTAPRLKGRHYAPERSIALSADAIAALDKDGPLAADLSLSLRREFEDISYLGPLRRKAERDYSWNKTKPGEVGGDGGSSIGVLLASALLKEEDQHYVVEGVSRWLARMKVAERLEVRQQGRSNRYELIVHADGVACNLRDVGVGVAQVLPVLVVAHFAAPGSTIILEEPEIHLHPLAQAMLAELFVEISQERQVQFLVETHSEHLFRRMQTLIAQGKARSDQAAMYFAQKQGEDAHLQKLDMDEFGAVQNWPRNFFGDSVGEARTQALARAQRLKS